MNARQLIKIVLAGLFCFVFLTVIGAEPMVSNVQASQRTDGSMMVDITYDLAGAGSEGTVIIVEVSPDGGATWRVPFNLSGDVGPDIEAGTNRQIVWDAGEVVPNEYWLNCLVKITAMEPIIIILKWGVSMELMKISAGSFMMGSPEDEQDRLVREGPQHAVNIGYDFYLGKYPVTKIQWEAMMGTTPWEGQIYVLEHSESPAVYVSWNDIRETNGFLDKLNAHLVSTEQPYEMRLPSEAEWEYAARAGTTTRFYWGDDPDYTETDNYAWHLNNIEDWYAHVAGQKLPNRWGLYDMSGNVSEWCEDDWYGNYHGAPVNGTAWVDSPRGSSRVNRGGAWLFLASSSRSAFRTENLPDDKGWGIGFRVLAVPR